MSEIRHLTLEVTQDNEGGTHNIWMRLKDQHGVEPTDEEVYAGYRDCTMTGYRIKHRISQGHRLLALNFPGYGTVIQVGPDSVTIESDGGKVVSMGREEFHSFYEVD